MQLTLILELVLRVEDYVLLQLLIVLFKVKHKVVTRLLCGTHPDLYVLRVRLPFRRVKVYTKYNLLLL